MLHCKVREITRTLKAGFEKNYTFLSIRFISSFDVSGGNIKYIHFIKKKILKKWGGWDFDLRFQFKTSPITICLKLAFPNTYTLSKLSWKYTCMNN